MAWARDLAIMVAFAGFVALCAQIAIRLPWTTVPITGQTFGVLVTGGALGAWRGAGALLIYMLAGMISMPVYAPGNPGVTGSWGVHFILPWKGSDAYTAGANGIWDISSGGYIVGFILAAWLVGFLAQRGWDRRQWVHLGMFLGNVVVYIPGILWLAYLLGSGWIHPAAQKPLSELIAGSGTWDKALKGGLYPFIVGDMMKLFLASLTLPAAWALAQRWRKPKGQQGP
jgi:biotin transport system substrate-specific component